MLSCRFVNIIQNFFYVITAVILPELLLNTVEVNAISFVVLIAWKNVIYTILQLSRNSVPIAMDNPQTSPGRALTGTTFYWSNSEVFHAAQQIFQILEQNMLFVPPL